MASWVEELLAFTHLGIYRFKGGVKVLLRGSATLVSLDEVRASKMISLGLMVQSQILAYTTMRVEGYAAPRLQDNP